MLSFVINSIALLFNVLAVLVADSKKLKLTLSMEFVSIAMLLTNTVVFKSTSSKVMLVVSTLLYTFCVILAVVFKSSFKQLVEVAFSFLVNIAASYFSMFALAFYVQWLRMHGKIDPSLLTDACYFAIETFFLFSCVYLYKVEGLKYKVISVLTYGVFSILLYFTPSASLDFRFIVFSWVLLFVGLIVNLIITKHKGNAVKSA